MTPPRSSPVRASGFTLLEVLLAVVVFAIVLAAIETVFYSALRLRNRTAEAIEQALPLQHSLLILRRDLLNLVPPGGTFSGPLQSATLNTMTNSSLVGRQVSPELYTATGLLDDNAPWAEIERVTYYLNDPTNRATTIGKDLIRAVSRNLLPVVQDQPVEQWMMSGVQDVTFQFCDGLQWLDTWDSTVTTPALPLAIKVQIQLAAGPSERQVRAPIELVVPVVVQPGTNQTSEASGGTL